MQSLTRREFIGYAGAGLALGNPDSHASRLRVPEGPYAVLISEDTNRTWGYVARELQKKHGSRAQIVQMDKEGRWQDKIRSMQPTEIAYVCTMEEAKPGKLKKMSKFARTYGGENCGGSAFGVITGFDDRDAYVLARCRGIKAGNALLKTDSSYMDFFKEGHFYSETTKREWGKKNRNGRFQKRNDGPDDTTQYVINLLDRADFLLTSGHANARVWESGYGFKDGALVGQKKELLAIDGDKLEALKAKNKDAAKIGKVWRVNSQKEKIWYPAGNCLIGSIVDENSMVPNAIKHMGVRQMWACVNPVFGRNYLGWGLWPFWRQGKLTFGEAGFAVRKALDYSTKKDGFAEDLDGFILYGDPALDARLDLDGEPEYGLEVNVEKKGRNVEIVTEFENKAPLQGYQLLRPVAIFPRHYSDVTLSEKSGVDRVRVWDNSALLDLYEDGKAVLQPGHKARAIFKAKVA